jgi:hypothetical protein
MALTRRLFALVAPLGAVAACSDMAKPGPQSAAGMSPVGTVRMTEIIAGGNAVGSGTLTYGGRSYSFKLVGGVTGGGAARSEVEGAVYNLSRPSDFAGVFTVGTAAGVDKPGRANLWLRNTNGVVLHLTGTQDGMVLSMGRQEVLVEML